MESAEREEPGDRPGAGSQHAAALERDLRDRERELARAQERIAALEGSTSLRVGRAVTEAVRHPGRGTLRLPLRLHRMWRQRRTPRGPAAQPGKAGFHRASGTTAVPRGSTEGWLLGGTAFQAAPRRGLVVAGIVGARTRTALAPDCVLNPLSPNDAVALVERTDPDLVLVETAAALAGGPWAYLGTPGVVERQRTLLAVVEAAHALNRPVVLWRNTGVDTWAGLGGIDALADLVVDGESGPPSAPQSGHQSAPQSGLRPGSQPGLAWSRGVQLRSFNPIGRPAAGSATPAFVGGWDRRANPRRRSRLIEALLASAPTGLRIYLDGPGPGAAAGPGGLPPELRALLAGPVPGDLADLYRRTDVLVADPFSCAPGEHGVRSRVLEQLACGARVISGDNPELVDALGEHVSVVTDPAAMPAALRAGRPTPAEIRRRLRRLYRDHATAVMLGRLGDLLGLSADPLAGRVLTVVARLAAPGQVESLVASVLAQRQRPQRVVVFGPAADAQPSALDRLRDAGVSVTIENRSEHLSWHRLTTLTQTPWLAFWSPDRPYGPTWLLDLLAGAECSGADAVGYTAGHLAGSEHAGAEHADYGFVPDLGLGEAVVRRDAARRAGVPAAAPAFELDASLADWDRRGLRLFTVGAAGPATDDPSEAR